MNNNFIDSVLTTEAEKQLWQQINQKLEEHLAESYSANIEKMAQSIPESGKLCFDDPIHPKHITTAPRELVIHVEAELSTINDKQQLEDISRVFDHYYHIAVAPGVDYENQLTKFMDMFDTSIRDWAPKINGTNRDQKE